MIELKGIYEVSLVDVKTGKTIAKEKVGASSGKEALAIAKNLVEEKKIWPILGNSGKVSKVVRTILKSSQDHEKEASERKKKTKKKKSKSETLKGINKAK